MKNRSSHAVLTRFGIIAAILATLVLIAPAASAGDALEVDFPEDREDLTVATFNASDPDADAGDIDWGVSGPDADDFEIEEGVLSFKKARNYESPTDGDEDDTASGDQGAGDNVYKVTVTASGGSQDVEVTVINVDEAGSVSFDKPQPQVTRDLTASFTDDDVGEKPKWQWSKSMDKNAADGDWMAISGATSAKRAPAAADDGYYLRATVTYEDSFGEKTISGVTDNAVEEETLSNAAPKYGAIDAIEVDENVDGVLGDPILPTDADGDEMQLALDGIIGDNSLFSYNSSGQLSLKDGLNYETQVARGDKTAIATDDADDRPEGAIEYSVMIKATDPSDAVGKVTVMVYLMDVNEAPKFADADANDGPANQKTLYIDENDEPNLRTTEGAPDSAQTITYSAMDQDGDADTVVISIEGADAKYFTIDDGTLAAVGADPATGKSTLEADYEDKKKYSITVVATSGTDDTTPPPEGGNRGKMYATLGLTITVVDGEDTGSASFNGGTRVPEVGSAVLAKVSDPDGGITGAKWQWYRGGAPAEDTDEARTTLITALKGIQEPSVCTDADPATPTEPCVIANATSSLYTPGADDMTFTIHAVVTYTDNRGTEDEDAVVSSEGAVQPRDPANTAPKFHDQDLNTPGDQSDVAMRSVKENKEGANVGEALPAEDAETDPKDLLIYTLNGADEANFSVDNTGQIKTAVKLDFETQPMHTVVVRATDPSGAYDEITVMIEVTDEPDIAIISVGPAENTAPAFDAATAEGMVDENMPMGAEAGMVMATDEDGDTLTYTDDSMYFDVDDMGNITTTMALDYEAMASHTVTVTASDGEDTATIDVTIAVGDMYPGCTVMGNNGQTNDCEILLGAKDALMGDDATRMLDWSEDTSIMDWDGVVISGDPMRVTQLRLTRRGLSGSIPASLGYLSELENLYLNANSLQGMVPGELGMLTNLQDLRLHSNELEGLEMGLGGMSSLTRFWAHRNHLSGSIPSDFGGLDSLEWLRLDTPLEGDGLSGGTAALGGMDSIERLYLHGNDFGGASVLSDVSGLDTLTYLLLQRSGVSGTIPDLSGMTSLVWLGLYDNGLSGGIPATVGSLANLKRLYLHGNALTGAVPMEIGSLASLTNLWLKNNMLDGDLPSSLDNLTDLERVRISGGNSFTGCIPAALANAASTDAADTGLPTCAADDGS